GEISLDLDMVSATAPNAHILLVEADTSDSDSLGQAVNEAVALGAKYVSNSYGSDYRYQDGEDPSDVTALDAYYNHPGVAVVASSGDYGYGVTYPAASPYVTSVGGTTLARDTDSARGWSETAWGKAGSGCSEYEPKPAFQKDTGCANRSVSDVSAVADPASGVAVYQTYGDTTGWAVYGGTSASSPIIAGVYADAATPAPGTYPNSYPYAAKAGLNDVTKGSNGGCSPAYLCTAAAGYDGPTGLGTPDGVQAFRTGPHGGLSGTLTDSRSGKPIANATVTAGTDSAHTDAQGGYRLDVPAGTYSVTATAFGYATGTTRNVTVTDGADLTENLTLVQVPSETVSGTVTDGSGHGWPLYAEITVDGNPNSVWSDPATGEYRLTLPRRSDFTLHVSAVSPGYDAASRDIHVATSPRKDDFALTANPWTATAPGYSVRLTGTTETFDSTTSAPKGWTVTNAPGLSGGWAFDDPEDEGNQTGGDGGFAVVNAVNPDQPQDTELTSPAYDLTGSTSPELSFDTMWLLHPVYQSLTVEASGDGGATWSPIWTPDNSLEQVGPARIELPLTGFAGSSAVRVRFHFTSTWGWYWGVDDVFVGQRDFPLTPGGMVVGTVEDANTGLGAVGARITDGSDPSVHTDTVGTPDDPDLGDGYFSMFVPKAGKHRFTLAKSNYSDLSDKLTVRADRTVSADYRLKAGLLRVTPASVEATARQGTRATRTITVENTGSAPATLKLGEQVTALDTASVQGAPLQRITGDFPLGFNGAGKQAPSAGSAPSVSVAPPAPADAWQSAPDLPARVMDNIADSYQGRVYAGFGEKGFVINGDGMSKSLFVLDPGSDSWTQLADATDTREAPGHGFIGGKLYIAGGWGPDGNPDPKLEIYDAAAGTWTTGAPEPRPHAAAGSAVLDGKLYVIGGCDMACGVTDAGVYDPVSDTWGAIADYPEPVSWTSCAGLSGRLYCAGGATDSGGIQHTYVYDPASNAWSRLADMPTGLWCSAYAAANGELIVSGGGTTGAITNQGFAFDPRTGTWHTLPNSPTATYRGAGALGFYKLGGSTQGFSATSTVENLPGYGVDTTADVPWLKESTTQLTLRPHATATVTVTLDAGVPQITGAGDYHARIDFGSDTPYPLSAASVTLHVTPSKHTTPTGAAADH
ncbi:Kelch repeat-containing protein, partial [Streptacidiphilus griseoplanus]|uniref:Kelch repeat-containing protein n=1 Tax=Peterkaempfera griseoplana TaxID=66896 RepID=UPI00099E8EA0